MRVHLTEIAVRALKRCDKQYRVWDSATPGFGCLVGKRKSWIVMFGPKRALKVIGAIPEMSLADARKTARKILADHSEYAPTPSFGDALDRYYEIHFPALRKTTAYSRKGVLERHFRTWAKKDLGDITPQLIVQTLDGLLKTPVERFNAFKELRYFYRWCIGRQYLKTSPCELLRPPSAGKPRERVLSDDELVRVWQAAEQTRPPFGTIVKLLILTGQRRGEIAALRGEYVNREKETIILPASLAKNGREHVFPYEGMIGSLLQELPRMGWLFPARGRPQNSFNGFGACKAKLDKVCGVDFGLHDLRRTFATRLAEIGIAPHVIERLLNHIRGQISPVAAIYNRHSYLPEMREAVSKWEAYLAALLAKSEGCTHTGNAGRRATA
jgi:integrase